MAASIKEHCNPKPNACLTCFLACGKHVEVRQDATPVYPLTVRNTRPFMPSVVCA
ncbi:MAG: hypothetical protein PHP23_09205 [Desulfobacterales bacterium]|nr:hypothetical protein [Desulfobacterales bacterium]MDD4071853.1 hypothetical protein [Desulfobacterales bacterium]MDD4391514.1 hypothetical protein [Desulfobacterales bacterium]